MKFILPLLTIVALSVAQDDPCLAFGSERYKKAAMQPFTDPDGPKDCTENSQCAGRQQSTVCGIMNLCTTPELNERVRPVGTLCTDEATGNNFCLTPYRLVEENGANVCKFAGFKKCASAADCLPATGSNPAQQCLEVADQGMSGTRCFTPCNTFEDCHLVPPSATPAQISKIKKIAGCYAHGDNSQKYCSLKNFDIAKTAITAGLVFAS